MKTLSDEEMEAVVAALEDGRKIEAIKIYREATEQGLKDAKEFIEALIPKLVEKDPERYEKIAKSGGGCSSLIVFAVLILAAGAAALQA